MEGYQVGGVTAFLGSGKQNQKLNDESNLSSYFKTVNRGTTDKQIVFRTDKNEKKQHKQLPVETDSKPVEETKRRKNPFRNEDSDDDIELSVKKLKKSSKSDDPQRLKRTIFVGNVSLSSDRKELKKFFQKYGKVEAVRTRSLPVANLKLPRKVAAVKKQFHADRNNMNAYVVFENESSAKEALASNGELYNGLHLRVDLATKSKEHDHAKSIFVGNLPFATLEEELRDHFAECGEVDDVRIIRDRATGVGKGFGYVRFQGKDGVTLGLKMNLSEFKGRQLRVCRSVKQEKVKGYNIPSFIRKAGKPGKRNRTMGVKDIKSSRGTKVGSFDKKKFRVGRSSNKRFKGGKKTRK